jgi:hypothetical protein
MATLTAIRIEGGLLGPDLLDQLLAGELPGQRPTDFGIAGRRGLTEEIASMFADARALWGVFQHRLERLPENDPATTVTRDAWAIPFFGLLGFELRYNQRAYDVDGQSFAVSHRAGEAEDAPPVHIVGAGQGLGVVAASGRPRLAPHSLVQEYLNRTEQVWGIVTNGATLRLLRNSTFVRRQAYVEFDLRSILEDQRFQDFAALYRLLHRTRLPRGSDTGDCLLEQYFARSVEQGGRVREHLRDGVEECIRRLANGFLSHPENEALRQSVARGDAGHNPIRPEDLYRQLLKLIYRLLFLLVAEDRGLLSPDPVYREHYGIARLRRTVDQRAAFNDYDDLWQSLRVLWRILTKEELAALLQLAPLNGDLFAPVDLDDGTISNRDLLGALWHLVYYQERAAPPRRVNYAALDVEELGSVYESLLEFHPAVDPNGAGRPAFDLIAGSERKTTGSYYTPPELVAELIKSALEPVLADRLAAAPTKGREAALLSIRVCDPACGSGHFLLAAARRMGKELARIRTGEDEPAPERVREAIRDVIGHCIYGVDKNPLAVDLCRVALWLESHVGDRPLTFLDRRIRVGDSLVGVFDLQTLGAGIPDEAFKPLEGDDRETARMLGRQNRSERRGNRDLLAWKPAEAMAAFGQVSAAIEDIRDDTPDAVRRKASLFRARFNDPDWVREKEACDLWTAAFFQPLRPALPVINSSAVLDRLQGQPVPPQTMAIATEQEAHNAFFHWPLEFPEVFAAGGFDVLLSNPPWERVKLQEQEFFAVHDARIANAANKAERVRLIKALPETNPDLHEAYTVALRAAGAASAMLRYGGRFPLAGRGDINTYAVFAELGARIINPHGRTGMILPTGIATDDTTKFLFGALVKAGRLADLVGFENEEFVFPAVDHRVTFCKLTIAGSAQQVESSHIAFRIRRYEQLHETARFYTLRPEDFALLNPNTGNCPVFRSQADAELTKAIYRRVPVLWLEGREGRPSANPWRISFGTMFHMANDSGLFRTANQLEGDGYLLEGNVFRNGVDDYLPLYEAKMLHHFDHRFSTYEGATQSQLNVGILPQPSLAQKQDPDFVVQPRYWVEKVQVDATIPRFPTLVAAALTTGGESLRTIMALWAAGHHVNRGAASDAARLFEAAQSDGLGAMSTDNAALEAVACELERDFSLDQHDAADIEAALADPEPLARQLVERFSPKWLFGWRDITNNTNERTMIASALPRAAVGHTFPLLYCPGLGADLVCTLSAMFASFIFDYCTRQKVGGTHITYGLLKQFPCPPPMRFLLPAPFDVQRTIVEWIRPRVVELTHSANDMVAFARTVGAQSVPFRWDPDRRFELRCELDAALLFLYLQPNVSGDWEKAEGETERDLEGLRRHFVTPRDAAGHVLEQFPQIRERETTSSDSYRTKKRIITIFDRMLVAQASGAPFVSELRSTPATHQMQGASAT